MDVMKGMPKIEYNTRHNVATDIDHLEAKVTNHHHQKYTTGRLLQEV